MMGQAPRRDPEEPCSQWKALRAPAVERAKSFDEGFGGEVGRHGTITGATKQVRRDGPVIRLVRGLQDCVWAAVGNGGAVWRLSCLRG